MRLQWLVAVMISASLLLSACGRGSTPRDNPASLHSISGTVRDASAAGAAGVTVTLSGQSTDSVTTGLDGRFSFTDLADGQYAVTPSMEGFTFSPESTPVTLDGTDEPDTNFAAAAIPPGHTVSGTVHGADAVTLTLSGAASRTTATDSIGTYSFTDLADGQYVVTPSKDGFTFSPETTPVTMSGADQSSLDFTATAVGPSRHSISGTVLQRAAITVRLSGAASATTTTGADETYSFTDLADGEYTVTPVCEVSCVRFEPESMAVTLDGADVSGVDFVTLHSIYGFITGVWTGDVTVRAEDASGVVGAGYVHTNGFYTIDLLLPGTYTVTPSGPGYAFSPSSATVTLADADVGAVNFTASYATSFSISGTVTGASGVRVELDPSTFTVTDEQGRYSFTGLVNGEYGVTPLRFGYSFAPPGRSVTLYGADATGIDFTAVPLPTHAISGTIFGLAESAEVVLSVEADSPFDPQPLRFAILNPDSTYVFEGLADWSYIVRPMGVDPPYLFSPESRTVTLTGADVSGVDFTATAP